MLQWEITEEESKEIYEQIRLLVRAHKLAVSPAGLFSPDGDMIDHRTLNIYLRDEVGKLIGALLGATYWGVLSIGSLWVDETYRHQGHAREMIKRAVEEARQRGCTMIYGNTWQTQGAYTLYDKLGAELVWRQDYPQAGQALLWYRVDLNQINL
jgi:GNAT superfamily N-acetyltransferase